MSKLNYCINGNPVTEQVIIYQKSKDSRDYLQIQWYYDNYKEKWYSQLSDYMDRMSFESDFDYKLSIAVGLFKASTAKKLQNKNGYGNLGAFNGLFYKILSNWKSNIKSAAFRVKRRPLIQCPICNRYVVRIDAEHLKHLKKTGDLPRFFVWNGNIYETFCFPQTYAITWGNNTYNKRLALFDKNIKPYLEDRRRVRWPWKTKDGKKGVMCPFTHKIVTQIDNKYIQSLPSKHSKYSESTIWEEFVVKYPFAHIQSEIFDLDKSVGVDENTMLQDSISKDLRVGEKHDVLEYNKIKSGSVPLIYESLFKTIEDCVEGETDRDILKLIASGHSVEDVSYILAINKKDIRCRLRTFKNDELKQKILELV